MYLLAHVGTRAGTPLYSASLRQPGQCIYLPVLVLVLVPLIQCFAWSARAMNLVACVCTCAVCESLHRVYCACIPCTVLRLVRTGNVLTCPWSYSYWYLLCSASLGQHGQCTYLPVVVLALVSARVMYLLARVRTRTGTSCAVLRLDSTGNVPTCPWPYSYWYLLCSASFGQHGLCTYVPVLVSLYSVQCFAWTTRTMYLLARGRTRTGTSCAVLRLYNTGYVPIVLVPLVQCFAWTARVMYLLARGRTRTGTSCAVLRLDSTGYVPMCPCLYPCTVFVQCFAWTARAMYLLARGRTRTGTSCAVLRLDSTGYVPMCPCLYSCTVFYYG